MGVSIAVLILMVGMVICLLIDIRKVLIMSQEKIDELLAKVEALKTEKVVVVGVMTDSAKALADLQVALKAAQDALANGGTNADVDAQIQTAIDGIDSVITDLKAKANPDAAPSSDQQQQ